MEQISDFVKRCRKEQYLTQPELARKAGVGLRFLRELEQGKQSLRMDKVNQVLAYFGSSCSVNQDITAKQFLLGLNERTAHIFALKQPHLIRDSAS